MRGDQAEVVIIIKFSAETVVRVGADASKGGRSGSSELAQGTAADRTRIRELFLRHAVLPDEVFGEVGRLGEMEEVLVLGVISRGLRVRVGLGRGGRQDEEEGEKGSHFWARRRSKASWSASPMELIMTMVPTRQKSVGPRIHQASQFSLACWSRFPQEGSVGGRPKPR